MDAKLQSFDGTGNVRAFLEKIRIHSTLKGYEGEKAAYNLASRLEGRAFDVYLRLSDADKKDPGKINSELLKEFESGYQDRELAIHELNSRKRRHDKSAKTYAYKIKELVLLAYPSFEGDVRNTIAKDYFVMGLHPRMQTSLKSLSDFASADINKLSEETTRLEIAGIESFHPNKKD